ncbi:multicopper oxidase family protein [Ferrovibrio xuzhouensis]|uniref:Multicopper oxidase family protein n=1 Tax=Ferrovibrio xuzhouensis TaxID=1576914 RepID=A0ABV7VBY0_9PROT
MRRRDIEWSAPSISRRQVFAGLAGLAMSTLPVRYGLAGSAPGEAARSGPREILLTVSAANRHFWTDAGPATGVLAYSDQVPGPVLRVKQGQPLRVTVRNRLDEDTTVHWHGIRLPNAMDGVPGLTQPPIRSGEQFVYEFSPPDAGTFWYHPHSNTLQQQGRGLAGALIVEEDSPPPVDRDILWVLTDWRLDDGRQIAGGFGNAMEAGMAGRIGSLVSINGSFSREEAFHDGETVRLRLINTSLARIMRLDFSRYDPIVIAVDGQPCDPFVPVDGRVVLGPAMRIDLILTMSGKPGNRYAVRDDFYPALSYDLTDFVCIDTTGRKRAPVNIGQFSLPRNPLPEPELATATRIEITLQGGMMGGMGGMMGMASSSAVWAINGSSMTGDGQAGMPPLATLERHKAYLLSISNATAWWHPMHLHGLSFLVISRNGENVPNRQWADTVLLAPQDVVEVAFVADNPGDWMFHCHVIDHQKSGLMTVLRIT